MDGFMNDIQWSFENISHEKIQHAIDIQQKVMEKQKVMEAIISYKKKEGIIFMRFSTKVWHEKRLYYGEIDDNICLCKLSAGQKQTFSFYDW